MKARLLTMFRELYDKLTMTAREKEDKKRFQELYKPFSEYFGLEEDKVSKSKKLRNDVLYGGYNKKESTAFAREIVLDSTYKEVENLMSTVEDRDMANMVVKGVKHYLNNDLEAIQQVNEAVYLGERIAYYNWYDHKEQAQEYEKRFTKSEKKLLDLACKNLLERVDEYDKEIKNQLAQQMNMNTQADGVTPVVEKPIEVKRKGSLAKKSTKTVEVSQGMGLGG